MRPSRFALGGLASRPADLKLAAEWFDSIDDVIIYCLCGPLAPSQRGRPISPIQQRVVDNRPVPYSLGLNMGTDDFLVRSRSRGRNRPRPRSYATSPGLYGPRAQSRLCADPTEISRRAGKHIVGSSAAELTRRNSGRVRFFENDTGTTRSRRSCVRGAPHPTDSKVVRSVPATIGRLGSRRERGPKDKTEIVGAGEVNWPATAPKKAALYVRPHRLRGAPD